MGVFGIFDLATSIGLEKHDEDFGQTLGYWSVGEGAYVVLPLIPIGMSIRDWTGFVVDAAYINQGIFLTNKYNTSITVAGISNTRANLLDREGDIFGDRYTFIRDAYLQNRRFLVNDGEISAEDAFLDDDFDYENLE